MPRYTARAHRRGGRILLGLAALTALLTLLVAVPLVLLIAWRILGPPWPSLHELVSPDDGTLFVRVLCLVGWAAWVTFAWSVFAEILAQAGARRLPAWTWQQRTAAGLITAITMMLSSPTIASVTATPARAAPVVTAAPQHNAPPATPSSTGDQTGHVPAAVGGYIEHEVQPGEQLPTLAERYLGDKYQWHVIAAATYGIPQPVGQVLRPGDTRMYPGQIARIPAAAAQKQVSATPAAHTTTTATDNQPATTLMYRANHGDWVWFIAERFLSNPQRYTDIATLNPQLVHKYGGRFPDHLEPGDELHLPADAHDRGPRNHATGTVLNPPPRATTPDATNPPGSAAPDGSQPTTPTAPAPAPSAQATSPTPAPSTSPQPTVTNTGADAPGAGLNTPPAPSNTTTSGPSHAAATSPRRADPVPTAAPSSPQTGIDLGDRGWVTAELAGAVTAAAALVWIHRRRRYQPRPPGPAHRDDPDLTPLPATVAVLHRTRRTPFEDDMDELAPQPYDAALVTNASLGTHTNKVLRLPDLPTGGVGLTGPGALAAGRGLLASALSAGGPWTPSAEATIITTADDLARMLPGNDGRTVDLERLYIADTIGHALDELERQQFRSARIATDAADLAATEEADPDDAPPPTVFLATAPQGDLVTRLTAILTTGARLSIVGVLLGAWPAGQTWHVNTDGTTTTDGQKAAGKVRLNVLDPAATLEILDTVRQAHPTDENLPPTTPPAQPHRPPHQPAIPAPAPPPDQAPPAGSPTPTAAATSSSTTKRRLRLIVLGRPTVEIIDGDNHTALHIRRRDGIQILVHLAVNPDGAASDELMATLWPEVRPHFSRKRFHTTISELRQTLVEATGSDPLPRTDDRYHLDPNHVHVDLWALNATIDQADTAVDPAEHTAALRKAIALYTGTVADGHSWLWLAPYREATRRHILDAHVALADTEPEPRTALARIQDAVRLDPFNEDLYQRAMRLHARLASPDGIRRTLRTLTERLNELEVRVSPQTQQVAAELLERLDLRERVRHGAP